MLQSAREDREEEKGKKNVTIGEGKGRREEGGKVLNYCTKRRWRKTTRRRRR